MWSGEKILMAMSGVAGRIFSPLLTGMTRAVFATSPRYSSVISSGGLGSNRERTGRKA